MLPLSLSLIIRSCSPISTSLLQPVGEVIRGGMASEKWPKVRNAWLPVLKYMCGGISPRQSVWKDPNSKQDSISRPEWLCLGAGVVCAALVTVAQSGMGLHGVPWLLKLAMTAPEAASKSFWMGARMPGQ